MQHSITIANTVTMTSPGLLELINEARAEFGESHVRHNDFVALCKDELDDSDYETFVIAPPERGGRPIEAIRMTQDQCKLVAMRGSKGVRRRVLARLNALEAARAAPALALLIDRRRAVAAQLAGIDIELAIAVGDRDAAQRAMREMNAQVGARYAARFMACKEGAGQ